ncbi:unnamed protein product [Clonostachys chloroleuca]|uniref:Uncharacterized protein n=1 Tax=Clonostachys chloroleuca TaxID=1926264 RepID=A0AA35LPV9_9HYPO|nr:unnamed protein product [Clonostachys chloroleuca]
MRAPGSLVKEALLALCEDNEVEKTALARLDALTKSSGALQGLGRKRKAIDDLAVCAQCDKPFYKDNNQPRDCESEVDRGHHVWDDHDDDCHGEIDSDYMREEHPEGYIWSCCDKNGKEPADFTRGHHESDPAKAWKEASQVDSDEDFSEGYED